MKNGTESLPEQHRFSLKFKDLTLEKEFRFSYDKSIKHPLRYGIIISLISWFSAVGLIAVLIPEELYWLGPLTIGFIGSYFGFIVYATYNKKFNGWYHFLGTLSNMWAGIYTVFFCSQFPEGQSLSFPALIFISFFGLYMIRLKWLAGSLSVLSYTILFNIFLAFDGNVESDQVAFYGFISWLTVLFVVIAGRVTESYHRRSYIQDKTINKQKLIIEKEKNASERLLNNMLPSFIVEQLKESDEVIAESHNDASVLFVDLVGFTELSTTLSAKKIVILLNQIFSDFDKLTEKYGLEKIKTIGDGYMVAGGLLKNRLDHLHRMARLALDMEESIIKKNEKDNLNLELRIGINSGTVVAGVIGIKKFTYDLWGDTVNVASRLESSSENGKIQVSEVVKLRLENSFQFEDRKPITVKGKGIMQTHFLIKEIIE